MKKTFDCVEMKRKGAEKLQEKLAKMTPEDRRVFWEERTEAMRERQRRLLQERKAS